MAKVLNTVSTIMVVIVVALAVLLVGFRFIGFDTYVVLSGSMEPTYKTGSLIYVKGIDPLDVEINDVITFNTAEALVTHRVIDIAGEGSDRQFITKGDANAVADSNPVSAEDVTGKVIFGIPYLGYIANYIQNPPGLYFAAAVGVMLVILMFITDALMEDEKKAKRMNKKSKTRKEESKDEGIK